MNTMEIARLIERCKMGEENALDELYRTYSRRMRSVCRRYVSDEQTIDDLLHDSFVVILTSLDRLRDERRAEPWMMAITRNVASKYKDHLRQQRVVPLEDADEASLQSDDSVRDVRGVALNDVMRLIDKLPEGYGKVFRLSVFEGLSHAEIAKMLDIEAHSSSSQLARAKQMLRKMLQRYGALLLLLLIAPIVMLWHKQNERIINKENQVAVEQKETSQRNGQQEEQIKDEQPIRQNQTIKEEPSKYYVSVTDTVVYSDSLFDTVGLDELADTVYAPNIQQLPDIHHTNGNHFPDAFAELSSIGKDRQQSWSLKLSYAGGYGSQDEADRPYSFTETPMVSQTGEKPSSLTFENWGDYAIYLSEQADSGSHRRFRSAIVRIALNNANLPGEDKILRTSHHRMPITWSLILKHQLCEHWGVETGLCYSRLSSEFEMGEERNVISEKQTVNYIGVPMKGIYSLCSNERWSVYGSAGLIVEMPLSATLCTNYYVNGLSEGIDRKKIDAPWHLSAMSDIGLQFNITEKIGLFVQPSLQYYIPTGGDIETYRTEHPFVFTLPVGVRITW